MNTETSQVYSNVIGGEFPLSPGEARPWLEEMDNGADKGPVKDICRLYGGDDENTLWLPYGRTALGLALELAGIGDSTAIALPSYLCQSVFEKVRAASQSPIFYGLETDLSPVEDELIKTGRRANIILTCAYFGSRAIDEKLIDVGRKLLEIPRGPWIIEDRAMAFPAPVPVSEGAKRCDFILYSLRKTYPVPDGAPLVACSERAREVLFQWRKRTRMPPAENYRRAIRKKIEAKMKRHTWLTGQSLMDDPTLNGVRESEASESAICSLEMTNYTEGLTGSVSSAAYIIGRDLAKDGKAIKKRSKAIMDGLRNVLDGEFPLTDCLGIAVPLLQEDREGFLRAARTQGIFLPVHWPRDKTIQVNRNVARWYGTEISLPTMLAQPAKQVDYLISCLAAPM